jgi:sec-independent protein translocase protein TatA
MLNNIGLPGLLLIAIVVLVLFGRGKISSIMGEVGKGITAFKRGVDDGKREGEEAAARDAATIQGHINGPATTTTAAPATPLAASPLTPVPPSTVAEPAPHPVERA